MAVCSISCSEFHDVEWETLSTCSYKDSMAVFRFPLIDGGVKNPNVTASMHSDEIRRAERFHRYEDRQRFIYSRAVLRILAGYFTRQAPEQIRFTAGPNKKPALAGNTGWHINLSHSGTWIVLAIGRVPVGIDVEKRSPEFSFQDILPTSFSQDEREYITSGPDVHRRFYQLWTRKEALVKATGKGMDDDFGRVPSLSGLHTIESSLIGGDGDWIVGSFAVDLDYSAAVAYSKMLEMPKFYTLNSVLFG